MIRIEIIRIIRGRAERTKTWYIRLTLELMQRLKSPRFICAIRKDGVIRVYFDDTYGGLLTNSSLILNMELKHGGEWKPVMLWIENDLVYTDSNKESEENRAKVKEIFNNATEIRYCYEDWYVTNIFSRADLPALSFCDKKIVDEV